MLHAGHNVPQRATDIRKLAESLCMSDVTLFVLLTIETSHRSRTAKPYAQWQCQWRDAG